MGPAELVLALPVFQVILAKRMLMTVQQALARTVSLVPMVPIITLVIVPRVRYGLVLSVLTKITVPQTLAQPNQLVSVLRPRQVVTVTWVTAQHGLAALPALAELTLVLITA